MRANVRILSMYPFLPIRHHAVKTGDAVFYSWKINMSDFPNLEIIPYDTVFTYEEIINTSFHLIKNI